MKKIMLFGAILALSACSLPQQKSTVSMDMQAVQAYQQRINTKNTVDKNHPVQKESLNQSDTRKREVNYYPTVPTIYPVQHYGLWYY